jgi:hypothetical protein
MSSAIIKRVPWEKFFLLWFLAVLMGTSLLWLHYGFTPKIVMPVDCLAAATGLGLLWGTTRPRWEKAYCSWCATRVQAKAKQYDRNRGGWVMLYDCAKCGHVTEKFKAEKNLPPRRQDAKKDSKN